MNGLRDRAALAVVPALAMLGGAVLLLWLIRLFLDNGFGEMVSAHRSPNGALSAYVMRESGFGGMSPDIVRVVVAETKDGPSGGEAVLSGSNLTGLVPAWSSDTRLAIGLPCSRFRAQNYYSTPTYDRDVEIVTITPDPQCWNKHG